MRAIVLGGGIAGLAAAIGLRRAGWSIEVVERAPALEPLGAALSLWSNALSALERLGGAGAVRAEGAPLKRLLLADRLGRPILAPGPVAEGAVMIARADLHRCLLDALDGTAVRLGREVARVEQDGARAMVHVADGEVLVADLLVDAGGIRSPAGAAWGAPAARHAGYGGVLALTELGLPPLDGLGAEFWGEHERFGVFELPHGRRYWFHMASGEGSRDPAELAARAARYPAPVAEAVRATPAERLIPVTIHAKPPPRRLGRGRVVAVGDAAHAMEPNLGQGACQAIEAAAALAAVAAREPPERVLPAFEALRLARARFVVARAAEGRYGAHGGWPARLAARTLLRAVPAGVTARMIQAVHVMPDYR